MEVDYPFYGLMLSTVVFCLGAAGVFLGRKSMIRVLMSIELMFLACILNFVVFSVQFQDLVGQIAALFVLAVSAAEVSIGLAILVSFYRHHGTIDIQDIKELSWR